MSAPTQPSSAFSFVKEGWRKGFDPARFLPPATPRMLAFCRIVVCAILLASVGWEDLASAVHLPDGMRERLGIVGLLEAMSFGAFEWLYDSWVGLRVLQVATALGLFFAMIGLWTRWTTLAGAMLYLLMGGILREYAWFYHTGVVPLYALLVLVFTPCGDAWSVDRWCRCRRGEPVPADGEPRLIDAWSVYCVWIVVAVPYLMAGLSKIRAGISWFHPNNFKAILLVDALQPMHFTFDFTDVILALPDWLVVVFAVGAIAGEIGMILVLFSVRARWIMPLVMASMHVVIWLLQRVLFFDLILIQIIFLVPPSWFTARTAQPMAPGVQGWPRPVVGLLAALALIWATRFEWYPLTDMHMYTRVDTSGVIRYPQIVAHLASGKTVQARPEEVIGAMNDARYRRLLELSKNEKFVPLAAEFFRKVGELHNRRRPQDDQITAFEVVWKRWRFTVPAEQATRGKVNKTRRYEVVNRE